MILILKNNRKSELEDVFDYVKIEMIRHVAGS